MKPRPQAELPFADSPPVAGAAPLPAAPPAVPSPRTAALQVTASRPAPPPRRTPAAELWVALRVPDAAAQVEAALAFTPRVSLAAPDALLLEVRGSFRLFGGLRGLAAELRRRFPAPARLSLAPAPLAALAFARAGWRLCCIDADRMREHLRALPVTSLGWPADVLARLDAMGIGRVGDLLRLPRDGFARRFGPALLDELDRLAGRRADPRATVRPAERFRERCELPAESADHAFLLRAVEPLLARLEAFLRERQRGVLALQLSLAHRRLPPTRCLLRVARPLLHAASLRELLGERLARVTLPAPVRHCTLRSGVLVEFTAASGELWRPGEQGGRVAAQAFQLLERLQSRLGEQAVRVVALVPEHRPERAGRWLPPRADARRAVTGVPAAALPPVLARRPLWLLREPRLLQSRAAAGRIELRHESRWLALVEGPERLESGWWDGDDVRRDYYVARDGRGARWWVFRAHGDARWFLHGCFG